ncbi:MAG: hypothetical protein ACYCV7_11655, partial [Acidimicrobiales bacterium]
MSPRPTADRRWGWPARLAVGAGALVVVAGTAAALALLMGRPQVSLSSSGRALVQVRLSGFETGLSGVRATSAGRPVPLVGGAGGLVPSAPLAQGQRVLVTATAAPPSWLSWLLGRGVSTTKTVRTPTAAPSGQVAMASEPGRIPVSFDHAVSVVEYRSDGGPSTLVHLPRAATTADLTVPSTLAAGSLQIAAAPHRWEAVASSMRTVTWFVAPAGRGPVVLAQP